MRKSNKKLNILKFMLMIFLVSILLSGCKNEESKINAEEKVQSDVKTNERESKVEKIIPEDIPKGVEVDLTDLDQNTIYSEVFRILSTPEKFQGMKLRVKGNFSSYYDEEMQTRYYFCIVDDLTKCCHQSIEILLEGEKEYKFPEDYPNEGVEIIVEGKINNYEELGEKYYYLSVENIENLENAIE